ncbi:LysR family transcriptional regulator [Colwellia psychrerythraea]|uniref:Transcriptional regulator, LysR family n=1 Tax=Colwellia psychrerythraea TaxID=28229 RepID=A0A099KTB0_COLPS|nr:LysR family transcriptional regulator [Colwellia psychrerythraea]KGJ93435.1 transcriptional regulator, LysR family [Colwellia psychrerythraea]
MDTFHLMKVYIAVAEEQGFSAASRRLNMSAPTVTRAVAHLEETLKVKLLNRTTRYVRMTEAGARYLDDAKRILHDVKVANEAALGINASPQGKISVTAPVLFGQQFVLPTITDYLVRYPQTQVNAVFLDRVVNLLEEGHDVGIRIGELVDSSMRAKKVGNVRLILVASPEYLAKNGIPKSCQELEKHTLIAANTGSLNPDWQFLVNKQNLTVKINPRLTVTTNQGAINAAKSGLGITRIISYQVAKELKNNKLKILLESFEHPAIPINIVHREDKFSSAKVRSFIDLLAEDLQASSALN